MINLVLAALVVFLGIKVYVIWSEDEERLPETGRSEGVSPRSAKTFGKTTVPPQSEYDVIVNLNLFSVGRSSDADGKKEGELEVGAGHDEGAVKLLKETLKVISIYGLIIVGDEKRALIGSPALPVSEGRKRMPVPPGGPPAGEEVKWVKVGEGLNRFTVNDINSKGVVLGAEGMTFDVPLYDKNKPKKRVPVQKAEGPIVIGGQDVPGGAAASGVAKETKKEGLPIPAATPKAAPKQEPKKDIKGIFPAPGNLTPEAVPDSMKRRLPNT